MATYILTWNPKLFDWKENEYNDIVERTRKGKMVKYSKSCGNTKRIVRGDRLFILRQAVDRGLIGSGYATGGPYLGTHWDKARQDEQALYVDLKLDTLLPVASRLPIESLLAANMDFSWNNLLASGIHLPDELTGQLESLWADHLA